MGPVVRRPFAKATVETIRAPAVHHPQQDRSSGHPGCLVQGRGGVGHEFQGGDEGYQVEGTVGEGKGFTGSLEKRKAPISFPGELKHRSGAIQPHREKPELGEPGREITGTATHLQERPFFEKREEMEEGFLLQGRQGQTRGLLIPLMIGGYRLCREGVAISHKSNGGVHSRCFQEGQGGVAPFARRPERLGTIFIPDLLSFVKQLRFSWELALSPAPASRISLTG